MILDVDAAEIWTITALDGQGDLVDGVTFRAGDPNIDTGDGSVTPWSLGVGNTNEIVSVQLSGSGGLAGFSALGGTISPRLSWTSSSVTSWPTSLFPAMIS